MFDTIVLLSGPAELPVLGAALQAHNPRLGIRPVGTMAELLAIEAGVLRRARLVGFATGVVVPVDILDRLGFGAYNFHPGSPSYPGLSPAQFAVYQGARQFGATAHAMAPRVDEGPIVDVELFEVDAGATVLELEQRAYHALAHLFWRLSNALATRLEPLPALTIVWSRAKSSRRSYAALCDIPVDISRQELERRIAAFGGNYFGIAPTLSLHGFTFRFVGGGQGPEPERAIQAGQSGSLCGRNPPAG